MASASLSLPASRLSTAKTAAQRKADQRRREAALAKAHMMRLPRLAVPIDLGDYLRGAGFLPAASEDDPEMIARGVEQFLRWLVDHAES